MNFCLSFLNKIALKIVANNINVGQLSGLYPLKLCIFLYFSIIIIIICLFPFLCAKAVKSFLIYLLICYYVLYINVVIVLRMK